MKPAHVRSRNVFLLCFASALLCRASTASADPVQPAQVRERVKQIHEQLYADGKDFADATDAELLQALSDMETVVWGYADTSTSIEARRFRIHVCLFSNIHVAPPPKP
jgi:hypothetical protein